jgi:hypothetical protein
VSVFIKFWTLGRASGCVRCSEYDPDVGKFDFKNILVYDLFRRCISVSFLSDYFCVSFSQTALNECVTGSTFLLHFMYILHFRNLRVSAERVTIQLYWLYWILVYA